MKTLGRSLLVATTTLLLTALGFAQGNAAEYDQYGNKISQPADRGQYSNGVFPTANPQFMKDAAQDAMAKIHLAYLALQNAQNEQVRAFAQQILNDYGKTQADLFNIANQQAVVLPNTLDATNSDTFDSALTAEGRGVRQGLYEGDAEPRSDGLVEVQTGSDEGGWLGEPDAAQARKRFENRAKGRTRGWRSFDGDRARRNAPAPASPSTRRRRSNRGTTSRPARLVSGFYDATSEAPATCALKGGATVRDSAAGVTTSKRCFSRRNGRSMMTYEA